MPMTKKRGLAVASLLLGLLAFQALEAVAGVQITSWYNNETGDNLSISISSGETVFFNVSLNGSVDSWNWRVNGGAIENNASGLTYTFDSFGGYNVTVIGSSGNETTQEIGWNITSTLCLTDDMDETVCLSQQPERIISLSPSNTEVLFAVGAGGRVVGVTSYCDYPPEAENVTKIGGYYDPSVELIVNASPDLIFSAYGNDINIINQLKDLGYTVIGLNPQDIDGVLRNIELVGRAAQEDVDANVLIANMEERINAITDITGALSDDEKMKALYVVWYDPIWVAGSNTYVHDLFEKAGAKNVASELNGWQVMNLESLLVANPEVIFCSGMGGASYTIRDSLMSNAIIQQTDAYLNGRIYAIDEPDIVERPGPRVVDGLEELYNLIGSNVVSSENSWVNLTAGKVTRVRNRDASDLILDVVPSGDSYSSFDISSSSTPFGLGTSFDNSLGKYVKINCSASAPRWAMPRIYYTDAELNSANLVESSLKMRWYNESSDTWVALDDAMDWVFGTGVSTESERGYSGYVWANVSHFSYYGVSGDNPAPTPPPSSGGGGGGGAVKGAFSTAAVKLVKAGERTVFEFDEALSEVVSEIDLSAKEDAYNVKISIETLKGKPYAGMPDPKGLAYKYLKVSPSGISSSKIDKAEVKFRVESSWLKENDMNPTTVLLNRDIMNKWQELEPANAGSDSTYYYYAAETPGFSYFAVTAEKGSGYLKEVMLAPAETPAPTAPPSVEVPALTTSPPIETPPPTAPPSVEAPAPTVAAKTLPPAPPARVVKPLAGPSKIVIGGVLLFALSVAVFILNRRDIV